MYGNPHIRWYVKIFAQRPGSHREWIHLGWTANGDCSAERGGSVGNHRSGGSKGKNGLGTKLPRTQGGWGIHIYIRIHISYKFMDVYIYPSRVPLPIQEVELQAHDMVVSKLCDVADGESPGCFAIQVAELTGCCQWISTCSCGWF